MSTYHDIDDVRGDDHIDSRDLIDLRDTLRAELEDADQAEAFELREGIAAITELEDAGIEDFPYGAHLIREDCFEDYARELAADLGHIASEDVWPGSYIDWPAAAQALKADFTEVDFLGHTYYVR